MSTQKLRTICSGRQFVLDYPLQPPTMAEYVKQLRMLNVSRGSGFDACLVLPGFRYARFPYAQEKRKTKRTVTMVQPERPESTREPLWNDVVSLVVNKNFSKCSGEDLLVLFLLYHDKLPQECTIISSMEPLLSGNGECIVFASYDIYQKRWWLDVEFVTSQTPFKKNDVLLVRKE